MANMTEDEVRSSLLARKAKLGEEAQASTEARAPVGLEQDSVGRLSRMDAMQVQAMALAAERQREGDRRRIDAALARLEEGEWGLCVSCGEEIPEGRLRKDPSVPSCVRCAGG